MNDSANFGKVIRKYIGSGEIHLDDGELRVCEFEVVQNTEGTLYALCEMEEIDVRILNLDKAVTLTGVEENNRKLTLKVLTKRNSKLESRSNLTETFFRITFIGQELTVESDGYKQSDEGEFRFPLTNFAFLGTEPIPVEKVNSTNRGLHLSLEISPFNIDIRPAHDYRASINEIRATRRTDITCYAIIDNVPFAQETEVIDVIDDLCLLLTLARGCRIEWPFFDATLPNGEAVKSYHRDAIIKPYSPLPLIARLPPEDIKHFIESSYPVLKEKKDKWGLKKAINTYTDAKLETDFLEFRALKMVIVMEYLKSRFLEYVSEPAKVFILEPKLFEQEKTRLVKECRLAVQKVFPNIETSQAQMMADHAQGFNYYTFSKSLSEMCITLGVQENSRTRRRFTRIRNELVHRLSFLDDLEQERSYWKQYAYLMAFVGKLLLAILEYDGHYYDWTDPSGYEGDTKMRVKLDLNREA